MAGLTRDKIIKLIKKGQSLERADMSRLDFSCANFSNANFIGVSFRDAFLSYANLSGADLSGADLSSAKLHDVNLENAVLKKTDIECGNLKDANLKDANLECANLRNANLENANLKNACLISSNLENAVLTKANISGANVFHCKINGWKIEGIECTHIYNYPLSASNEDRARSMIKFEKGQFEEKYKTLPAIELSLSGGLLMPDIYKICRIIGKMNKMYNTGLGLVDMRTEVNGIVFTLKVDNRSSLEEIMSLIVQEYGDGDLDKDLMAIISEGKLLGAGIENLDIYEPNIKASRVFSLLLDARISFVNRRLMAITEKMINPVSDMKRGSKTSMVNNYISNKKEIDRVLEDFNKLVTESIQQGISELKIALKERKEKEMYESWKKIEKLISRADEMVKNGDKTIPIPYGAVEMYHKLNSWFMHELHK